MREYKLAEGEARFAELIWQKEPITSPELVKLCEKEFQWKKSTTYTVLRKICSNGIFRNEHAVVVSCMSRDEYARQKGERYLAENYNDPRPGFVAAFLKRRKLNKAEIEELAQMIEEYREQEEEG